MEFWNVNEMKNSTNPFKKQNKIQPSKARRVQQSDLKGNKLGAYRLRIWGDLSDMLRGLSWIFLSRDDWRWGGGDKGVGAEDVLCLDTGTDDDVLWPPLTRSASFCLRSIRLLALKAFARELERELALERLERLVELEYELELELEVEDDEEKDDPDE